MEEGNQQLSATSFIALVHKSQLGKNSEEAGIELNRLYSSYISPFVIRKTLFFLFSTNKTLLFKKKNKKNDSHTWCCIADPIGLVTCKC